jgi:hypothetical protein
MSRGFITRDVKVVACNNVWIFIIWVRVWIPHLSDMHKYCALIVMPMHILHYVLDLKLTIVFSKVNFKAIMSSLIQVILKAIFELLIMRPCNKIVMYKISQLFRLQNVRSSMELVSNICMSLFFFFLRLS